MSAHSHGRGQVGDAPLRKQTVFICGCRVQCRVRARDRRQPWDKATAERERACCGCTASAKSTRAVTSPMQSQRARRVRGAKVTCIAPSTCSCSSSAPLHPLPVSYTHLRAHETEADL
eukprot:876984-Rhodomonas_salina.1